MLVYLQMIDTPEETHKFEVLYRHYRQLMFAVANRILQNEQDAEDAVHMAFLSLAENMKKISEPVCPKTKGYIVTITENKAIDLYRRKRRQPTAACPEHLGTAVDFEQSHCVAACLARLADTDRHILMLKYRYGYDAAEIARLLRISRSAAAKRVQRAKERLEEICREEGVL